MADDVISQALSEVETSKATDRLSRLAAAKARSLQGDPQLRLKLLRYLLGRGYSYDDALSAASRHSPA